MTRRLSLQILAGVCLAARVRKPNLSGNWEVDKTRSTMKTTPVKNPDPDAPPAPPPPPADSVFDRMPPQTITHNEPNLTIKDGNAPPLNLTTDGKENVTQLSNGAVNRSKSQWDGNQLVTQWSLERNGAPMLHGVDRRSLSDGGGELIDERTVTTPFAETQFHIVWKKK